jgi:N-acetyltransferase
MPDWVQPVVLHGNVVRLEPLDESHAEGLAKAYDPEIFRFFAGVIPADGTVPALVDYIQGTRSKPMVLAFAIVHQSSGQAVGVTTYLDIRPEHRGLEIGSTWLGRDYQGTSVNPEAKLLLLTHAFEQLGAERVQLKTDMRNLQSRAAILKLGAVQEGILRRHAVLADGYVRDTVMFSILASEWPLVKARLEERLAR